MTSQFQLRGVAYERPMFLPVFEWGNPYLTAVELAEEFGCRGLITNGFFLYKNRELRQKAMERGVKAMYGFDGLVVTDSGAFQGFHRPLPLRNRTIIKFQQEIGADVVSPLDVVTTPGESKTLARRKMEATLRRVAEGMPLATRSVLAGVQQGGRYEDLREEASRKLSEMGCAYVALGSLVPFFNRLHDVALVGRIIRRTREIIGANVPIHLYGAGDPVELPFYAAMGCDLFDSSSYVHYARQGWYMTRYGAVAAGNVAEAASWYDCRCPWCRQGAVTAAGDESRLVRHNLWTIVTTVAETAQRLRDDAAAAYLDEIASEHGRRFPESRLPSSWEELRESRNN